MKPLPYQIIAHRGTHKQKVENSMASVREAFAQKADIVEMDVRMTKDREFIILHDYFLERTTTGTGWVMTKRLAELKKLQLTDGEQIPSLEEVLDYLNKQKKGRIMLDIKDVFGSFFDIKKFLQTLRDRDLVHRTIVSSFNPMTLHRIRKEQEELDLAVLTMFPYGLAVPIAKKLRAKYIACIMPIAKRVQARYFSRILPTETFLGWARREGLRTIVYWEEGRDTLAWLLKNGVTLFETNKPAMLRKELQQLHKDK